MDSVFLIGLLVGSLVIHIVLDFIKIRSFNNSEKLINELKSSYKHSLDMYQKSLEGSNKELRIRQAKLEEALELLDKVNNNIKQK